MKMTDEQIDALKAAYTKVANERIAKWEALRNEGMVVRAKADATTGFGMLCSAIDSMQLAAPASNVVALDVATTQPISPGRVLDSANAADLESVIVVGYSQEGKLWFAGSHSDGPTTLWAMEQAKYKLLALAAEQEEE